MDKQNDTIKLSDNVGLESVVDSATHKLLISDTTLRSLIPLKVSKTIPNVCHICGREICIILKDIQIYLNILITRLVTYLQQKSVSIHTLNSLFSTTSATH